MDLDWKGFNDVSDAGLRFAERAVDRVERNPVIDAAKGYGILLVVLGHSVYYDSFVFRVIFNFHMPLFFFLSGMTYFPAKFSDSKACLVNIWRTLGVPFLFFVILGTLICLGAGRFVQDSLMGWLRMVASFVHGAPCVGGSLWFLSCLAVVKFLFWIWHGRSVGTAKKIISLVVAYLCGAAFGNFVGFKVSTAAPLMFFSVPMAFFFFTSGFLCKNLIDRLNRMKKPILLVLAAVLLAAEMFLSVRFPAPNMAIPAFPSPLTFLPAAFCGILSVICFSAVCSRVIWFVGLNSLYYFLFERWARELWLSASGLIFPGFMPASGEMNPNLLCLSPFQVVVSSMAVLMLCSLVLPSLRCALGWFKGKFV